MEHRQAERIKQRLTCELVIGDRNHQGIVLDVSNTGLFIQTSASPPPGERIGVKLRRSDGASVEVEASVARRYRVPQRLASVARGGVGLRIASASDDYLQLIDSVNRAEKPPPPEATDAPSLPQSGEAGSYSVRVRQTAGTRSRSLRIAAVSEHEAKRTVSAGLEEGWEILSVDLLEA
jgi:hypothetical protein